MPVSSINCCLQPESMLTTPANNRINLAELVVTSITNKASLMDMVPDHLFLVEPFYAVSRGMGRILSGCSEHDGRFGF